MAEQAIQSKAVATPFPILQIPEIPECGVSDTYCKWTAGAVPNSSAEPHAVLQLPSAVGLDKGCRPWTYNWLFLSCV